MLVVIHYGEIALKGGNREMFEDKLVGNIKKTLNNNRVFFKSTKKPYGRIVVEFDNAVDSKNVENCLNKVFGITHFSFAYETDKNIEKIKEKAVEILREKDFETFKIETKRSNKNFALTSPQVNQQIGEEILKKNICTKNGRSHKMRKGGFGKA